MYGPTDLKKNTLITLDGQPYKVVEYSQKVMGRGGSIVNVKVKNLITAGRCISVTDDMLDITRVIPDCAVTGEAAGVAAAMSDDFANLDVKKLQAELERRGVKLHESEL